MVTVSVNIDEKTMEKLRALHAKKLQSAYRNISFSRVINEVLEKGLKS